MARSCRAPTLAGIGHTSDYHVRVASRIRDAHMGDLASLNHVYRRAALSNDADRALLLAHPEVLELTAASLTMGRTRVAAIEGRIVGYATSSVHGDRLELDTLFVDPDLRRRGIARDLVMDAVAFAQAGRVYHIEVTANVHAAAFYDQMGFVEISVIDTPLGVPAARLRRPAFGD
jgi:ribosomal protein S18 acetylase RimI-like enzyme